MKGRLALVGSLLATVMPNGVAVSSPSTAIEVAKGAFVHHHVVDGYTCGPDEVMVGIHIDKRKATCARLNYGYQAANATADPPRGTDVSANPSMHGCPPNYLIRALERYGEDERLTCVPLVNNIGQALVFTKWVHDGRGKNNDGTRSTIYGVIPTMHACPRDFAMQGIHQHLNDL